MRGAFKVDLRDVSAGSRPFAPEDTAGRPVSRTVSSPRGRHPPFLREVASSVPLVVFGFAISFFVSRGVAGPPGLARAFEARVPGERPSTAHVVRLEVPQIGHRPPSRTVRACKHERPHERGTWR